MAIASIPAGTIDVPIVIYAFDRPQYLDRVCAALEFVSGVCAGDERGGTASTRSLTERFGFLKAPKSTVVQPGPVHGGVAQDPAAALAHLRSQLVG